MNQGKRLSVPKKEQKQFLIYLCGANFENLNFFFLLFYFRKGKKVVHPIFCGTEIIFNFLERQSWKKTI